MSLRPPPDGFSSASCTSGTPATSDISTTNPATTPATSGALSAVDASGASPGKAVRQRLQQQLQARHWHFALAGVVGLGVDIGSMALLLAGNLNPYLARLLAFLLAVLSTWQINRRLTFADRSGRLAWWQELARYLLAMSGGGLLNLAASALVLALCPHGWWLAPLAVCSGSAAGMVFNYCAARFWVFR